MPPVLTWRDPEVLRWLWLALPTLGLVLYAAWRRRQALAAFLGAQYEARDWRGALRRRGWRDGLLVAALALLVLALARPQVGMEKQRVPRAGADVVLVFDTSLSMLARDVRPSRLEAARTAALTLLGRLEADRVGVVAFAGRGYMYCPLTLDYDAAAMFIGALEEGTAPDPGTSLAAGVGAALEVLGRSKSKAKAMVIFTDGEDQEGAQATLGQAAKTQGVVVHVVGLGSTAGEPIPLENAGPVATAGIGAGAPDGSRFKTDRKGEVVISRLNDELLKGLAAAGGGVYARSSETGADVETVVQALGTGGGPPSGTWEFKQYAERFQWPLGLGLLALVGEGLLATRRRRVARSLASKVGEQR